MGNVKLEFEEEECIDLCREDEEEVFLESMARLYPTRDPIATRKGLTCAEIELAIAIGQLEDTENGNGRQYWSNIYE